MTGDATGLAEALVFRIAALTDPAPVHRPEPLPADLQPPDDAHLLPPLDVPTTATADPADVPPGDEDAPFDPDYDTPPPASPSRYRTPDPFTLTGAVDAADDADYLLEQHFWATAVVGRDRLIELNTQAAAFFTTHYPDSWAPGYLHDRLGTDLTGNPRFTPGYAPAGWTTLVDHLRGLGATDEVILAAGLAQHARTGALIDRFRDRLTFSSTTSTARSSPSSPAAPPPQPTTDAPDPSTSTPRAPTCTARASTCSGCTRLDLRWPRELPQLSSRDRWTPLPSPWPVAGRSSASPSSAPPSATGKQTSSAPTSAATVQASSWPPTTTPPDAERIYWQLTTRGDNPRRLALPDGLDPAGLLHRDGATALRRAIDTSSSPADALLDARLTPAACDRSTADIPAALRDVGAIIAALPPGRWLADIDRATEVLDVPPGTVHQAVLDPNRSPRPVAGPRPVPNGRPG